MPSLGRSNQDRIDAPTLFYEKTQKNKMGMRIDNQSAFRSQFDINTHTHEGNMGKTAQNAVKRSVGRPIEWSEDNPVWEEVVSRMATGKSLSSVLREPGMPPWATFNRMLRSNEQLRVAYDKAVQDRADKLADEIIELSDAVMPEGLRGPEASAWVQQKRLQVDARKWVASKLKPRTYGDRIDVSVVDQRISVIDAINEAQARVSYDRSNVTDIEVKNEN